MSWSKQLRLFLLCLLVSLSQQAWSDDFAQHYRKLWQLKRLFSPGPQQLKMEQQQKIFIYIGLTDKEVDQAMDENFDRIESIMLANVIITDDDGKPKHKADSGEVLTEDDGC